MKTKYELTLPAQEQPFTHFELDLNKNEQECLANFKIDKMQELSGTLEELEYSLEEINTFISSLGENDFHSCSSMVQLILKLAHQALTIFQQECAYIILRASIPNEEFKLPRWHQDAYYYHPFAGQPFKAAIPLKGAGTLFYRPNYEELEKFKQIEDRKQRDDLLIDPLRIEPTPSGFGSLFIVGHEAGAIHSEPYINSQRFFMSVLPGKKKDIQDYNDRQNLVNQMLKDGKSIEEIGVFLQARLSSEIEERNTTANLNSI